MMGSETSWYDEHDMWRRMLQNEEEPPIWQAVVVGVTLTVMFLFMLKDWVGPDWVMTAGLIIFMVTEIVDAEEALVGFSNDGILTVLALLVMADGVSRTGLLDYYMGLVLGKPRTVVGAQLRLMLPIAILSAFLNNTPIVAVAIPVVLRWAKTIQVPRQQLLIPLSYATILGGTCTLVGTSTNLVVNGKLKKDYPGQDAGSIGLFDLGVYGLPNALFGIIYMLSCSSFLLPNGSSRTSGGGEASTSPASADVDDLLLGARVMPWSPSAGRTVKRSGLSDAGGIYLVNVKRYATGNLQYAVSRDFVLSVGDELYFTGRVEQFSDFCQTHGLAIITTEQSHHHYTTSNNNHTNANVNSNTNNDMVAAFRDGQVGVSHVSTFQSDETERLRIINCLMDQIAHRVPYENVTKMTRVIVTRDDAAVHTPATAEAIMDDYESVAVIVAVDTIDRPGLMVQISDTLFEQGLQVRHSEAKVVQGRSLSIWRCTAIDKNNGRGRYDYEAIWEAVHQKIRSNDHPTLMLHDDDDEGDTLTTKRSGTKVIRATVTKSSRLIGQKAADVHFRKAYKASIVAYQKNGKNTSVDVAFDKDDVLVLNAFEGSPLLIKPPANFYAAISKPFSAAVMSSIRSMSNHGNDNDNDHQADNVDQDSAADPYVAAWKDLRVTFPSDDPQHAPSVVPAVGEFLTAFVIADSFPIKGRSVVALGYARLPSVVLVSVERPVSNRGKGGDEDKTMVAVSFDEKLEHGDVLWYAGSAEAIVEMKRVHGLTLYQESTIQKATRSLQDRRLVQAVIARSSPLIGLSIKEARFRTEYGGVVIAVQRGTNRIREHPGKIVLQTGDVLLVEAGPSFALKHAKRNGTFALVSEVENSAPPRPKMFLLCVVMIVASLAVAALDIRSLLVTATLVGIVMTALGVLTQQEARSAIQWDLFIVVAAAFGVGKAMENSGVARRLGMIIVTIGKELKIGDAGLYGAVYFAANLLSAVLTNNAAALLMYPIAMEAVDQSDVDRRKMAIVLMLAASDYMTSFGYQTNLMVYGPGGYSNMDFMKFGGPMQVILWLSTTAMVSAPDEAWYISWIISLLGLAVVVALRFIGGEILLRRRRARDPKRTDDQPNDDDVGVGESVAMIPQEEAIDEIQV